MDIIDSTWLKLLYCGMVMWLCSKAGFSLGGGGLF